MLGTLRPDRGALDCGARAEWAALYCGLCHSLGQYHGSAARATLSHDVVLWAALAEGLADAPGEADTCRCPLAPWQQRTILAAETPSMRAAAAVQLILDHAWLRDSADDGSRIAALATRWSAPHAARALETLDTLGLDLRDAIDDLHARQLAAEADPDAGLDAWMAPTRQLMRALIGQLARLPGAHPLAQTPSAAEALDALGDALGRVVYLIDALGDLPGDLRRGQFNPCLAPTVRGTRVASMCRVERCVEALDEALRALRRASARTPWRRHDALLAHIFTERLPERAAAAARRARAFTVRHGLDDRPVVGRLRAAWIACALWLLTARRVAAMAWALGRQRLARPAPLRPGMRLALAAGDPPDRPPAQLPTAPPSTDFRRDPRYQAYLDEEHALQRRDDRLLTPASRRGGCCPDGGTTCCFICEGLDCLCCLADCAS